MSMNIEERYGYTTEGKPIDVGEGFELVPLDEEIEEGSDVFINDWSNYPVLSACCKTPRDHFKHHAASDVLAFRRRKVAQSGWIKLSDKEPAKCVSVLCSNGGPALGNVGLVWVDCLGFNGWHDGKTPAFWHPIIEPPEPPKPEKSDEEIAFEKADELFSQAIKDYAIERGLAFVKNGDVVTAKRALFYAGIAFASKGAK